MPTKADDSADGSSTRRRRRPEETEWLKSRLPEFIKAQALKNTTTFWPKIQRDYFTLFPVFNMNNPNLTEDDKAKVSLELQARTSVSNAMIP